MAVRIRMKKLGRTHRAFFRICAVDQRSPRDGRVLEELGTYDPMVSDTDARAVLRGDRVDYWLSVGAQPSEKVSVLIKKYGSNGTHLDKQREALERMSQPKAVPEPGKPAASKSAKAEEGARDTPEQAPPEEAPSPAPAEQGAASE